MKSRRFVPLIAAFLSTTVTAIADGRPPFVLPTSSALSYRLHEDANGPDGTRQRDLRVSLALQGDGYDAVVSSSGHPDESLSLALDDGTLTASAAAPDDQRSTVEPLRYLASLVHHEGPIVLGQTWTTAMLVELPGGESTRVPLSVTVDGVRGDDVTLAASGDGAGTIHGHGHSAKATIGLVLQASFHDGHVVSATTAEKVTAHVPFHTITFTDTWTVAS